MKTITISIIISCLLFSGASPYTFIGAKWSGQNPVVKYVINEVGTPDVTNEVQIINEAFSEWTSVNGTAISAQYDGEVNSRAIAPNRQNLVLWEEGNNFHYDRNVIAICAYWYTGTLPGATLTDFDITFNGRDFEWSTSGESGKMDVKSIAVHEIGHALGVGHSDDNAASMYPYATIGDIGKRGLSTDDSLAIVRLYPRTVYNNHAPVITSTAVTEAIAGMKYRYEVKASDEDGDTIRYKLVTFPLNMKIDSVTGVITWWPKFLDLGNHSVVVEAKDSFGAYVRQSFTIKVGDLVVSMPDTIIPYAETLYYPVNITSMDGYGILAGNIEIAFNRYKVTILDIDTIGSVISGTNYAKNVGTDTVKFAFAGSIPYSGDGILLRIKMTVNKEACGEPITLTFKKVLFNDGNPVATTRTGTIFMSCGTGGNCSYNIGGQIIYESNRRGVGSVKVKGPSGAPTISNNDGFYELTGQPRTSLPCSISVSKDSGDVRTGVSAFDASLILRNVVGLNLFNSFQSQIKCADVNTNLLITAYDAALILRFVVGIDDVTRIGHWIFTPVTRGLPKLLEHTRGINFEAALVGDVSGNWNDANSEMPKSSSNGVHLSYGTEIDTVSVKNDSLLREISRVRFAANNVYGIYSGEFSVAFDTTRYNINSVTPSAGLNGFTCAHNTRDGQIKIAFAGTSPIAGNESLFDIELIAKAGRTIEDNPVLTVSGVRFNEATVNAIRSEKRDVYGKGSNSIVVEPNPFNPTTTISYDLQRRSNVKLSVFDVSGREIVTLVSGKVNGGNRSVVWNGSDKYGNSVGGGVYFATLVVEGKKSAVVKMLLMK